MKKTYSLFILCITFISLTSCDDGVEINPSNALPSSNTEIRQMRGVDWVLTSSDGNIREIPFKEIRFDSNTNDYRLLSPSNVQVNGIWRITLDDQVVIDLFGVELLLYDIDVQTAFDEDERDELRCKLLVPKIVNGQPIFSEKSLIFKEEE